MLVVVMNVERDDVVHWVIYRTLDGVLLHNKLRLSWIGKWSFKLTYIICVMHDTFQMLSKYYLSLPTDYFTIFFFQNRVPCGPTEGHQNNIFMPPYKKPEFSQAFIRSVSKPTSKQPCLFLECSSELSVLCCSATYSMTMVGRPTSSLTQDKAPELYLTREETFIIPRQDNLSTNGQDLWLLSSPPLFVDECPYINTWMSWYHLM